MAQYISLAIDNSGVPYVAYSDAAAKNNATVMKFNSGTSTWETVGKAGTLQGARRSRDKRDNEYGGYNHHILDSTGKRRRKLGGKIDLDDCKITSGEHKNPKHKGF